jgi:predicted nucleotidyltransferase
MHQVVAEKLPEIEALCRELGIRRLDLFGSATGYGFNTETSDIDVLVEFDAQPGFDPKFDYFGPYFGLKEGLESGCSGAQWML